MPTSHSNNSKENWESLGSHLYTSTKKAKKIELTEDQKRDLINLLDFICDPDTNTGDGEIIAEMLEEILEDINPSAPDAPLKQLLEQLQK